MKYFTRGWHNGDLDDRTTEDVAQEYRKEIEDLSRTMSPAVRRLAMETDLHDAIIERVVLNEASRKLTMYLVAGDLQIGYNGVQIAYEDVRIDRCDVDVLEQRANDRCTCILSQEIGRSHDGHYIHKLLFWPEGEVSVSFRDLMLTVARRENRRVDLAGHFVAEDSE